MKLKLHVGQIFLTHPKDENFAAVYEESFSREGGAIDLFAVIEVAGIGPQQRKTNKADYDKLAQVIVGALKRTYISAPHISEETFEKALANVNSAIARLGSKEKMTWFGRLGVALGAVAGNVLALSVVGGSVVYLYRHGESSLLSGNLAEDKPKPTKLFANYASGGLAAGDRVILSSRELLNFLSLDRLENFLAEETLEDACQEIITALSDVKDVGFATYLFETANPDQTAVSPARFLPHPSRKPSPALANSLAVAKYAAEVSAKAIWQAVSAAVKFVIHFFQVRPKKYLFVAIALMLVLLLGNIALTTLRKNSRTVRDSQTAAASEIEQKLSEAESALIYNNETRTVNLTSEIEELLSALGQDAPNRASFTERLANLKNKVSREVRVDNPTVLTAFPGTPTHLVRSPNGFLGFNKDSGRLSFYDFRVGATKAILQNQNTGNLGFGVFLGNSLGFMFLHKDGKFVRLDIDTESLTDFSSAASAEVSLADLARGKALAALGEDANSRLYSLGHKSQAIWRLAVGDAGISAPERWLKTTADFSEARALAVDGSVYVLYPERLEKYFNGTKQNFQISALTPPAKNLKSLFATAQTQFLYLTDPDNKRILIISKQGQLQKQIVADKFREVSDIFVDEKAGLLYALAGGELLQINLK